MFHVFISIFSDFSYNFMVLCFFLLINITFRWVLCVFLLIRHVRTVSWFDRICKHEQLHQYHNSGFGGSMRSSDKLLTPLDSLGSTGLEPTNSGSRQDARSAKMRASSSAFKIA